MKKLVKKIWRKSNNKLINFKINLISKIIRWKKLYYKIKINLIKINKKQFYLKTLLYKKINKCNQSKIKLINKI